MNYNGFKYWLQNNTSKSPKLITDCVSRALRVEKAFQSLDPSFSFENEFNKDQGISFIRSISRRGVTLNTPVPLPIGINQMDPITTATKIYFAYLCESFNRIKEDII